MRDEPSVNFPDKWSRVGRPLFDQQRGPAPANRLGADGAAGAVELGATREIDVPGDELCAGGRAGGTV